MAITLSKRCFFCWVIALFSGVFAFQVKAETTNKPLSAWSAKDIAIIVNDRDPLSVEIADYYQQQRGISPKQIIHLRFSPRKTVLSQAEFTPLKRRVDQHTPAHVQGFVLTWAQPYRVACMSIGTAFAAGFDTAFCAKGCKDTRHNPYFDSDSKRPFDDFGWRLTMVLAAKNFAEAKALIDRGLAADASQPKGAAYLLKTSDSARSSRAVDFPEVANKFKDQLVTHYWQQDSIAQRQDVMFYFTGLKRVPNLADNRYLPGAVADHLTSAGGMLTDSYQMSALAWLQAGATGSYGAVVEPCNITAKFSNPRLLMAHYLKGSTLIEAYWKSVAEPGQGIFIGEPLAKPYAKKAD